MNISVCITTLNEEESIAPLLDSLLAQTKKPDQIIIVDAGSADRTIEIIRHYQKKDGRVKLLVEKECSRAKGRNLGVEIAKNGIIAMTDAGCVADKNWLKRLLEPFKTGEVDVSAGFYHMAANNSFEKAESIFLGVQPNNFDITFLPSTRSIAFTKEIWEKVGGFPEKTKGTAEDTLFNLKLVKNEAKIARVKNAIVEWGMPGSIKEFGNKIFEYAKGDAKSKVWFFPGKGVTSHNIKALSILFRYIAVVSILVFSLKFPILLPCLTILIFVYLVWAYRKAGPWGPILQVVSDFGVMRGFVKGLTR